MGLLEEIKAQQTKMRLWDQVTSSLAEPDLVELYAALDDPSVSPLAISRALRNRGISISDRMVGYERRKRAEQSIEPKEQQRVSR